MAKKAASPSEEVRMREKLPVAKRYIITAAQNATPVYGPFWRTLQKCVKFYDAELVVIPGRYKNPTSQWTVKNEEHEWWADEVMPFLSAGRFDLNDRLMVLGDVKIQWAARDPLSTMDGFTQDKSGIVGHGCRALRSIPTPQHRHPKIMVTTGACTRPNYTDTKRGKTAEFNHCYGALIVELDGETFFMRELNASRDGSFIDLNFEFTQDGVRPAPPALTLTMGDTHRRFVAEHVVRATFDAPDSMAKRLRPRYYLYHDVVDFHARNHHHDEDWVTNFAKWKFGKECVRTEVNEAIDFVNKKTPSDAKAIIVASNHDGAMDKWLKKADFRRDPVNAEFFLEAALRAIKSARMTDGGASAEDPFIAYAKTIAAPNAQFLKLGESFVRGGVEHGFHGHKGPNGSRATTRNLSKLGIKVTKGHSHVAEILDGCYSAGKSTGMLEYEVGGPSSHSNSHVVLYANRKRAILFIINGRYALPPPPTRTVGGFLRRVRTKPRASRKAK